jgi:hypothetical protein
MMRHLDVRLVSYRLDGDWTCFKLVISGRDSKAGVKTYG